MKHISRWRTITAAAATATVAAGATGLTAVTASPNTAPAPIEVTCGGHVVVAVPGQHPVDARASLS